MRDAETILADFDNPLGNGVADGLDSSVSSVRQRVVLEALLDSRRILYEIYQLIGECKEELVEIKNNTA